MKIYVRDYPTLKQEVLIGDRVICKGYEGIVEDTAEDLDDGDIQIKFDRGRTQTWDKDCVLLLKKK